MPFTCVSRSLLPWKYQDLKKKENQYNQYLHPTDGNPVSVSQPIDSPQEDSIGHVWHNAHTTPLLHVKKEEKNKKKKG